MAKTTVRKTGEQFIFWWWTFLETNREMSFKNLTWTGMSPMICKANGVKFPLQKAMCSSFSWLFNNLTTTRKLRAYTVVQMPLLPISETTKPRSTNDKLSQPPPWPTPAFLIRAANKLQPAVVRRGICRKSLGHWHLCKIFFRLW